MLGLEGAVFVNSEVGDAVLSDLGHDQSSADAVWKWLRTPPSLTVLRVNTHKTTADKAKQKVEAHLIKTGQEFSVTIHHSLPDVLLLHDSPSQEISKAVPAPQEIIVDEACGLAVLRGADIFSPGILGMPASAEPGESVSVWSDLERKCLRGSTAVYQGKKVFIGNGVLLLSRANVFKDNVRGLGVRMTQRIFQQPSLNECESDGEIMLQNLPSILTVDYLAPLPGERVLDMCAAPGGKTTHIATRMKDEGEVIAFDKSHPKIEQIQRNAKTHGLTCIRAFVQDGVKSVQDEGLTNGADGDIHVDRPPYPPESFDRVILDAPCSALGQRPQFYNKMGWKELCSFPKIQRKLFAAAVRHLKPGGTLIYSTCTSSSNENQAMVTWALSTYPELSPVPLHPHTQHHCQVFGSPELTVASQDSLMDTISFFVCKFIKKPGDK